MENCRAGFEKWQLYSYSVNPEGGAAIGIPSIEEVNDSGRGAIGTPDDALRVLENYWTKTGGFDSGGSSSIYAGSFDTVRPSFEVGSTSGGQYSSVSPKTSPWPPGSCAPISAG